MAILLSLMLAAVTLAVAALAVARSVYLARRLAALEAKPAPGVHYEIRESNTVPEPARKYAFPTRKA